MDKKLERLYEQLGRIDSVIEKQTSQRLEKMKEIQQKRDADKRAWMKEASPVIDTFLLEAVGENYYYDITPADLTAAVRTERLRATARKEEISEGKAEGTAAETEAGNTAETTGEKPGTDGSVKQKEEEE